MCFQVDIADFVEKERAAVGLLQPADAIAIRTGKGSFDVTEKFAFQQVLRQGRAVNLDERPGRRGLEASIASARSSLPVPLSPRIKTAAGLAATLPDLKQAADADARPFDPGERLGPIDHEAFEPRSSPSTAALPIDSPVGESPRRGVGL